MWTLPKDCAAQSRHGEPANDEDFSWRAIFDLYGPCERFANNSRGKVGLSRDPRESEHIVWPGQMVWAGLIRTPESCRKSDGLRSHAVANYGSSVLMASAPHSPPLSFFEGI